MWKETNHHPLCMVPFGNSSNFFVQGEGQFNTGHGLLNWEGKTNKVQWSGLAEVKDATVVNKQNDQINCEKFVDLCTCCVYLYLGKKMYPQTPS